MKNPLYPHSRSEDDGGVVFQASPRQPPPPNVVPEEWEEPLQEDPIAPPELPPPAELPQPKKLKSAKPMEQQQPVKKNTKLNPAKRNMEAKGKEAVDRAMNGEDSDDEEVAISPEWEVQLDEVQLGQFIGRGGFGEVYKGMWRGTEVRQSPSFNPHARTDGIARWQ